MKEHLRPDVSIYLEYSNEASVATSPGLRVYEDRQGSTSKRGPGWDARMVGRTLALRTVTVCAAQVWHTGFVGGQYAELEGLRLRLGQDEYYYGGAAAAARLCYLGYRTRQIKEIWKDVFGSEGSRRLRAVVAGQAVWSLTSDKILSCNSTYRHVDALAIAPYFGEYNKATDLNLDDLMVKLRASITEWETTHIPEHRQIAQQYQVGMMARATLHGPSVCIQCRML